MRISLADARNSRIPPALGLCGTSSKFTAYLNEATERLLRRGLWWGAYGRYRICADDNCITLPVQLANLESLATCGMPAPVRDMWYEFLANGPGPVNGQISGTTSGSCCGGSSFGCGCSVPGAILRGHFCTFKDIIPSGKKLNLICDLATDVGKTALCLGYDDNGNWIRTLQGGSYKDGEVIAFAQGAGTNSLNFFSSITDIQLPSNMDGQSWLYEYNNATTTKRMIGHYQYFETRPSYARYFFPQLCGSCSTSDSTGCSQTSVEIIAKHEFIPVVNDTDYLILSNIPALKEMCVAIKNAEQVPDSLEKNKIIASGMAMAMAELDAELAHYVGNGHNFGVNLVGSSLVTADPVPILL